MWAAVRFFGPRWKSTGKDSKWLSRYGREYLKTGGEIHFVSKDNNRSISIEVVTDSTKLEKQRYDTDWFRRYVDWIKQTENEPFAVLQSTADMCDAIENDAPNNSFPVFDPEIQQIDIKAEKINPASMQLARSLNAIKNSEDTVFSEVKNLFNMYGNVDDTYHHIGHHIGDEFHCPNLNDTIKTFGDR